MIILQILATSLIQSLFERLGEYTHLEVIVRREFHFRSLPQRPLTSGEGQHPLGRVHASVLVFPSVNIELLHRVAIHVVEEPEVAVTGSAGGGLEVSAGEPGAVAVLPGPGSLDVHVVAGLIGVVGWGTGVPRRRSS